MKLGSVSLRVRDLDAELAFYQEDLGLRTIKRDEYTIDVLAGEHTREPILNLRHDPEAKRTPTNTAGLFHYAILLPDRRSLAQTYLQLGNSGVVFDGYADHLVSEALYLTDPEGNGIEIYADKPRSHWPRDADGDLQIGTQPLDIDSLLKQDLGGTEKLYGLRSDATTIGHVHLKVTELKRSIDFYTQILGFDIMNYWGSAAFLAAAGYHHHIGLNTWESLAGRSHVMGSCGLEYFTIVMPDSGHLQRLVATLGDLPFEIHKESELAVIDPDGIKIVVKAASV
jgi:catechol 2,3-dioxygenase